MKTKKNGDGYTGEIPTETIQSELQSCVICVTWLSKVEGQKMKDQVNAFMQVSIIAINFCNSRKYPGLKIGTTFMNEFSSDNKKAHQNNKKTVSKTFLQAVFVNVGAFK